MKSLIDWLTNSRIIAYPRMILGKMFLEILLDKGIFTYYINPNKMETFNLIRKIKKEGRLRINYIGAIQIFLLVKKTENVEGDIAEVGTYTGGSSKVICEAKGKRNAYFFDTFEGLPSVNQNDSKRFFKGEFKCLFENVKDYLSDYPNINIYKGIFPATSEPIKSKMFSFVHLDVDIYQSTKDCLEFFYPRMNSKGIIVSHDYQDANGVKKAFDEFFEDKPETVIGLANNQCLVVKI